MMDSASMIHSAFSHSKMVGRLSERLRGYALARCLDAAPYLELVPAVFDEYTDHGVAHSCTVLKLADKLLANNELSGWEILIFVLSAFYHDIGMSCSPADLEKLSEEPRFRLEHRYIKELILPTACLLENSPEAIERQIRIEYIRRHHGERCQGWITKEFPPERPHSLIENLYVWEVVSQVCIGHTLSILDLNSDVYSRSSPIGTAASVDRRFLTCLLRLADICHLSRDRALPFIRKTMKFKSWESEQIWEAVGEVAGVDCEEARGLISVSAQPRSFERHSMISSFVADIGTELMNAHRLLSDKGALRFPWRFVDDSGVRAHPSANYLFEPNARFRLVQDKIVGLLMGSKLYADPLYALRECLQNSVDAIRLYRLRDSYAVGRIIVQHRVCPDGAATLEIFDNGTGMDRAICLHHLLSVGSDPFGSSERRYKDWGTPDGSLQLIAQHGIGFLSCFMLADKVEVFSKYPDAQRVHLVLESPTGIGEFRTTEESEFPQWSATTLPESTPWAERHGTCVRLHLREPISKLEFMRFLSENILRTGERIAVIYGEEFAELIEIWGPNGEWPDKLEEEASLAEMANNLSLQTNKSGLGGPPHDASLENIFVSDGNISGVVRIVAERYESPRLSQEGILIRDGASSLLSSQLGRGEGNFPFYFDVDVRRNRCFELDAERSRITATQGALASDLIGWIEERGLRSIEAIESSLFSFVEDSIIMVAQIFSPLMTRE